MSSSPSFDPSADPRLAIRAVHALRGPNIWAYSPALEAWVDLDRLRETASTDVPGFVDRLMGFLPALAEHGCSTGARGEFLGRLREGTYPAHILEHVALELQSLAGAASGYGRARMMAEPGLYRVVLKYRDEGIARAALVEARALLLAAYDDRPFDVPASVARLRASATGPPDVLEPSVPVVAIAGGPERLAVARRVACLLRDAGQSVALAWSGGIEIDGRAPGDRPRSAFAAVRGALAAPGVETVVVALGRCDVLAEGLAFRRCAVGVVLGLDDRAELPMPGWGFPEPDEHLPRAERCVVEVVSDAGWSILNADDPRVAAMAEKAGGMPVLYARDDANPALAAHRAAGGHAVFPSEGRIVLTRGLCIINNHIFDRSSIPLGEALPAFAAAWAFERIAARR